MSEIAHAKPATFVVHVCPECGRQWHPGDGKCSKDVRPGQFKPHYMYRVVPLTVVSLDAVVEALLAAEPHEVDETDARGIADFLLQKFSGALKGTEEEPSP